MYCVVCGCIVGAMFAVVSVTSVVDVSVEVSVTDSVYPNPNSSDLILIFIIVVTGYRTRD